MMRLIKFLSIGKIILISFLLTSCIEQVDPTFYDKYTIINKTDSCIKFVADDIVIALNKNDTICYDNFHDDFLFSFAIQRRIEVADSIIVLSAKNLCWQYNCKTEYRGEHVYMRTYVINDEWLINV